jgi:lipid A 3-O-deacylase
MKHFYLLGLITLFLTGMDGRLYAQERSGAAPTPPLRMDDTTTRLLHTDDPPTRLFHDDDAPTRLLRIYEDDDFLNIRGQGTDNAYTNGTRIELFYTKKKPSRFFFDRVLPTAGDSSINIFGWGAMELMYTPNDIANPDYQPNDYPWSGALAATHTLYSYNPQKKYDIQTEVVLGVIGPAALGEQLQTVVHRIINSLRPAGWDHQFRNALLLNVNFTAEKQLASWGPYVEVIGGSQVLAGTMQNSIALYPLIRIGKMAPYFNGFFSQYTGSGKNTGSGSTNYTGSKRRNQWQAYFVIRPEGQLIFTNALLEGGLFTRNPNLAKGPKKGSTAAADQPGPAGTASQPDPAGAASRDPQPYHALHRLVGSVNYGAVVSSGHFGISFIQNTSSAMMKGLYSHEVGNLSVYYAW